MGENIYVLAHIFWGWIAGMLFLDRFYRPLTFLGDEGSTVLLSVLVFAWICFGVTLTYAHHRSLLSMSINVIAPFGTYLALEILPDLPFVLVVPGVLCLVALGVCTWTHVRTPLRERSTIGEAILVRVKSWLYKARVLAGLMFCAIFALCVAGQTYGFYTLPDQPFPEKTREPVSFTLEDYRDQLTFLVEKNWESLDESGRLKALQTVVDIETAYLGLPEPLTLEADKLDERTLGDYVHSDHRIRIDSGHLNSDEAEDCMRTIFHEVYHSFQYQLCQAYLSLNEDYQDLLPVRSAASYLYEFNNYVSGRDDFESYAGQQVEQDARSYAADRMKVYRPFLYELGGRVAED